VICNRDGGFMEGSGGVEIWNLQISPRPLLFFLESTHSLAMRTASKIYLPATNAF